MGQSKEYYMAAHEQLVEEYMEEHPNADWTEAYDKTADAAHERARDNMANAIDQAMSMRSDR